MSLERKNELLLSQAHESQALLDSSRAPEYLEWVAANYNGAQLLVPESKLPTIQLVGPYMPWNKFYEGSPLKVTSNASMRVGFVNRVPVIEVIRSSKQLLDGEEKGMGSYTKRVPEKHVTGNPLLAVLAEVIARFNVLNPTREEIDFEPLKRKAAELDSIRFSAK